MILPCGVSSAPNRPRAGLEPRHIGGDEPVEKAAARPSPETLTHANGREETLLIMRRVLLEGSC